MWSSSNRLCGGSPLRLLAVYQTDRLLGGGEISFTLTLNAVQSAGREVLALVPAPGPLSDYLTSRNIQFRVAEQGSLRNPLAIRNLIRPPSDWLRIVHDFRPNLIHCSAVCSALYGQAVGRHFGIPAILHARIAASDPADPFLIRRLQGIICISAVVQRRFAGRGHNLTRVIYNAVNSGERQDPAHALELRKLWQLRGDDLLVGLPIRLSPDKGQVRLIQASPAILQQCPEA